MKPQLTMIAVSLILAGCGGGSTGKSTTSTAPTYTAKGKVAVTAARSGTTVCVDYNNNLACDKDEPTAKTDANGEFAITDTNKKVYGTRLIAKVAANGSASRSTTNHFVTYLAPARHKQNATNVINGVSTMLAGAMEGGLTLSDAEKQVTAQLKAAGIDLQGSLMDNLEDNALATLETNMGNMLAEIMQEDAQSQAKMLYLLNYNFEHKSKHLAKDDFVASDFSDFKTDLSARAQKVNKLHDSGMTLYYSDSGDKLVDKMPADFPGQDAAYGLDKTNKKATTGNGFDLVKLDATGKELADDAKQWSCVLDKQSNLIWETKSADSNSIRYKERIYAIEIGDRIKPYADDLADASCHKASPKDQVCTTQQYADYLNKQKFCGLTDWRLPKLQEAFNLLDFGETTAITEGKAKGEVYGLTYKYFPNQPKGDDDNYVGNGEIWLDEAFKFNESSEYAEKGTYMYAFLPMRDTSSYKRGAINHTSIYSSLFAEVNYGTSYLLPVRMVAVKGK